MKKTLTTLLAGILLIPLSLAGCGTQGKQLSDVQKITYVSVGGDMGIFRMYVLTPDYTVKCYDMSLDYFHQYDVFAGELPSKGEYWVDEYQISEEEWNALINTINDNNFAELPEELPEGFVTDGVAYYIQVETSDDVHKSGGYEAGRWDDKENKYFHAIQEELRNIIEKAESSQPDE